MGDFGADKFPAVNKMRTIAFNYKLFNLVKIKVDQFPTDNDDKVYSFVQKLGSHRLLIRVNPNEIPG